MSDSRERHRQGNESAVVGEERQVGPTVSVSLSSGVADFVHNVCLRLLQRPGKPGGRGRRRPGRDGIERVTWFRTEHAVRCGTCYSLLQECKRHEQPMYADADVYNARSAAVLDADGERGA